MSAMYAVSINEAATAIRATAGSITCLVQGDMGWGKTSILKLLAAMLPDYIPIYFDCTIKDAGDLAIPVMKKTEDGIDYVHMAPNEELGMHLVGKKLIIMVDELGKANRSVQNGMLRLMQERQFGTQALHPDSIVFATTNKGSENVGDTLLPHARNRITILQLRKSTNMEWIEWGINNGIDFALLGWCKDTPQLFQSFEDVAHPTDNPLIYHPKDASRTSFVTGRSLEKASHILKKRKLLGDDLTMGMLIGTIGGPAAADLMTHVRMADQLPSQQSIKDDPHNATVPTSAAAICLVVYRALASIDKSWVDAWLTYMLRLDAEAQGMFANGAMKPTFTRKSELMLNKKWTDWARTNGYLFAADMV
jgi:hypothetical protein